MVEDLFSMQEAQDLPQHSIKGLVTHAYNPSTQEVGEDGSEVQGHLLLKELKSVVQGFSMDKALPI